MLRTNCGRRRLFERRRERLRPCGLPWARLLLMGDVDPSASVMCESPVSLAKTFPDFQG